MRTLRSFHLFFTLAAFVVASCGGGGGGGDTRDDGPGIGPGGTSLRVGAAPYAVTGTELPADLSNPDTVLAAGIIATLPVAAYEILIGYDTIQRTSSTAALRCALGGSGTTTLTQVPLSRARTDVVYNQCNQQDDPDESLFVRNGQLSQTPLNDTGNRTAANRIDAGAGADGSFVTLGSDLSESRFGFVQVRGAFVAGDGDDTSGSYGFVQANRLRLVVGAGAPSSATTFVPSSRVEILVGDATPGLDLSLLLPGSDPTVFTFAPGLLRGPIAVRTTATPASCNFSGTYSVDTESPVFDDNDNNPVNGAIRITSGAQSARVAFSAEGDATVTDASGGSTTYTAAQVHELCGVLPFDFSQF